MNILIVLAIIAVLIFIHELGHFLAAKLFGIRVDTFAVGFPPRLLHFKRGDTTYQLNLIPLGGYVKIFGENPDDEALTRKESPRSMINKPAWQQVIVLLAGIFFNLVLAWIGFVVAYMISGKELFASLWLGLQELIIATGAIIGAFAGLLKDLFTGSATINALTGPVGLIDVVEQASQQGLVSIFILGAFISINLAVLNILPFPALDGGRVAMLLIEKLKGSPIKPKVVNMVNAVGFFLLIVLMVAVTVNDVLKII